MSLVNPFKDCSGHRSKTVSRKLLIREMIVKDMIVRERSVE